jgi:DNA polymerase-3 subunit delta
MLPYTGFSRDKVLGKAGARRIYGVLGDSHLQSEVVAALLGWLIEPDARDFNMDTLDGESCTILDVMARSCNLPFLSDRRLVLVQRAERIEGLNRGGDSDTAKEKGKVSPSKRLSDAIAALPQTTTLILCRTPETPEAGARKETPRCINAAVDKAIEAHGIIVDCTVGAKAGNVAVAALQNSATKRGIPLAPGAIEYLVGRAGNDIANGLNELEKCALRAGEGQFVTREIIDEMVKRLPQDSVFDLMDAIGARNMPRALGLLRELVGNGEAPELVLSLAVRHLRQLMQARAILDARLPLDASLQKRLPPALAEQLPRDSRENLASVLIGQGWRGPRLAQQARNFSMPQLVTALNAALEADLAMKGIEGDGGADSKVAPQMLLELFLAKLA